MNFIYLQEGCINPIYHSVHGICGILSLDTFINFQNVYDSMGNCEMYCYYLTQTLVRFTFFTGTDTELMIPV